MSEQVDGWFFDAYPVRRGMVVWLLDKNGAARHCFDPFRPSFYLRLDPADSKRVPVLIGRLNLPATVSRSRKRELFSGDDCEVVQVTVHDPLERDPCVRSLQKFFPHFAFYNSNIPLAQMYLYEKRVFPLARCRFTIVNGMLDNLFLDDSFDAIVYDIPPLRVMRVGNGGTKFFRKLQLEISYEGKSYSLEQNDPVEALEAFNWHLYQYDPDVVITAWGDATLFPAIAGASEKYRVPLLLNRDQTHPYMTTKERSYWTYGQVIHRDASFMLAGRWHIDSENSFLGETDLDGNIEVARLAQIPMQKQSRSSIGTGLASMQMSYAYRNDILIPAEKKEGEDFKTAEDLLLSDRGGLVFLPELGYHENVAELDFASMYPSLMETQNISPETVNCSCCRNGKVPELHYTICEKRRGIVPITLKPVIEKRAYYKSQRNMAKTRIDYEKYDRRQNALKWMLVTCFGYLGYKNARFGRIEAHEAVNAFSREALLTAKEIAESNGYHLVHAIIDCLWLKKSGATDDDYRWLCEQIRAAVKVNISLEGIYNWILFPSSKLDPGIPTAGKYVGWYRHGESKMRGIEARRKDVPAYIKEMQKNLLILLSGAKDAQEVRKAVPDLLKEAAFYIQELRRGRVNPHELVLRRRVQKEAEEYANKSLNAMVVKELLQYGVRVKPGETIEYVIIDQTGKDEPQKAKSLLTYRLDDGYDIEKYTELLLKAIETLLSPFGYNLERLKEHFELRKKRGKLQNSRELVTLGARPGELFRHDDL